MIEIIPLNVGNFLVNEKSNFLYLKEAGMKIKAPTVMWYLKGTKENIIVDTGPSDPEQAALYHHPMERSKEQTILGALASVGLKPDDVKIVINTHLHWDHVYGNSLFKQAEFIIQKKELEYAENPLPCHYVFYETKLETQPFRSVMDKYRIIDGDIQLTDDVSLIHIPGHTPGMQGVVIETGKRRVILAADAIPLFENWEADPPIPSGIHYDLASYYQSFAKIQRLGGQVLPGHDMRLFEQYSY